MTIALIAIAWVVVLVALFLAVTAWGAAAFLGVIVYVLVGAALALWAMGLDPREVLR